jgi:hypothetical protein
MSIKRNKKYFLKMDPDVPSPLPATVNKYFFWKSRGITTAWKKWQGTKSNLDSFLVYLVTFDF